MGSHAWLDSLSEDWVSQHGSDASITAPAASREGNLQSNDKLNIEDTPALPVFKNDASRIPRLGNGLNRPLPVVHSDNYNSSNVLSERSVNELFGPASRRTPSKLSQEVNLQERGRYSSRSVSVVSSSGSVVHNTVHHKSLSLSPVKRRGETPEWKRRLVDGDLSFGEQRDLFTSAGAVLENIFKPPPPAPRAPPHGQRHDESYEEDKPSQYEVTLPSSPPQYHRDPSAMDIHVDESLQELPRSLERRAPTAMRYTRTEDSPDASEDSDLSVPPDSYSYDVSTTEQTALSPPRHERLQTESRKASNRSVVRNEDFSPIILERRQASNGKETFGPADLPPDELRKRLEKLRRNQMLLTTDIDCSPPDELSRNATIVDTTTDFERLGGFINFRRGGRSADGSFRNHGLSSAMNDTSELLPEESLQASTPKQFPSVRVEHWDETKQEIPAESPDIPRVPNPSPDKKPTRTQASSGSPLKLFQPYDTFTNQTLLRRMSQFQENADDSKSFVQQIKGPSDAVREFRDDLDRRRAQRRENAHQSDSSFSQFGAGELDGYEFHDEFSYESNGALALDGDKENRLPEGNSMQLPRAPIFDVSHDSSPSEVDDLVVERLRQKSVNSASSRRSAINDGRGQAKVSFPNTAEVLSTPKQKHAPLEFKRPRTSPSKDPTPKRRRTLHKSDIAYEIEGHSQAVDSVQVSHQQMQSVISKKRKDARHGEDHEFADSDVLAARRLLRPRTPTPNQRSPLQHWERPPLAEMEKSPGRSARLKEPALMPVGSVLDIERKPSIKTEDFINEANKIMAMIRSKAGIASGLASLEESDAEYAQQPSPDQDSSYQESTQEPFSRPPSREGRAPVARMSARQEDPELAERLKMYEEASDMGDIIGSSMRSATLGQDALDCARDRDQGTHGSWNSNGTRPSIFDDDDVISDPPNIRISHNPEWKERQSVPDGMFSFNSAGSSSHSTGRSIPTGSSRGSESRKTIAPENVQHLIPDQVGNMILDKQRNIWIKRKPAPKRVAESARSRSNFLPSEASEDDPFAGIPDLSVDMTTEMQNLRLATQKKEQEAEEARLGGATPAGPFKPSSLNLIRHSAIMEAASATPKGKIVNQVAAFVGEDADEAVEHEIKIHEGRASLPKRRNLTISFSSPIASVIQDVHEEHEERETPADESSMFEQAAEDFSRDSIKRGRRVLSTRSTAKNGSRSRSTSRGPPRHLSVRGQTFVARPISRIDEREEESAFERIRNPMPVTNMELSVVADNSVLSHDGDGGRQSLSFVVSTPARPRDCPMAGIDATPIISQYVGTLSLSPLSEFTIHQGDESMALEASYVVGDHHLVTGDHSKRVMSMNTRDLVEKLAEVEPFEPYWDDMRELDLRDKRLESLHALGEFCDQLESLDVSNNVIRNLNGIPSSIRHLKVTNNQLSSLTAWSHLINLQYVDISNNGLTSLTAFTDLVHLRSLKVDNNYLTSLDGIKFHNGLQTLRARGNAIEELDFDGNRLDQLTELDLKNNKISCIANLAQLPGLSSLTLDGNQLESFAIESDQPLPSLRHLRLDDNKITSLDIKLLPHLRLLHADRNSISQISGLSRARRIDSLSLREQRDVVLNLPHLLARAYEVRKLYLSGNLFTEFAPTVDFLNLQLLELANCGLQSLPDNIGLMMPNLRVLNLNLNALSELQPLRYIPRLKRLLVSGNRLASAAGLVDILTEFEHLSVVDVRDNPVTQGFYPPVQSVVRHGQQDRVPDDEVDKFALPDQDAERGATYASRLDMNTRMRRRLYEHMFCGNCRRVKKLDGLSLRKDVVAGLRDAVWRELKERGMVVLPQGETDNVSEEPKKADESARWPGEDSFA
ncbi:hypothetical protein B0H63DRAFT_470093 [Podospora didyma]|uniref:Septation initiation network scaffold protein cdc11 n=1 Tax=Podospora didyma TaxID=330526 RepID=A0AAE0NTL4_9PEZI|nr:hypothetical protein B0H63DRAFT_470093 [Podospora didyma]